VDVPWKESNSRKGHATRVAVGVLTEFCIHMLNNDAHPLTV